MLFIDAESGEVRRRISHTDSWFVKAVNGDGVYVGYIDASATGEIPFEYVNDHVAKLPLGAGTDAAATAINGAGAIVGTTYYHTETVKTATLWLGGKSYDLNRRCHSLAGWKLEEAVAINSRGTILCNGKHNGRDSACLLIPDRAATK